jgi:tetratricopeptide (TPR) repeat protein
VGQKRPYRARGWLLAALLWSAGAAAQTEPLVTTQARDLVAQGEAEERAGRPERATQLYVDALTLDATMGRAYLLLGQRREQEGDPREAERVFTAGAEHVPGFAEVVAARARLRWRSSRHAEALDDLAAAAAMNPNEAPLWEELAGWSVERGRFVQALALYRRFRRLAEASNDAPAIARARLKIRALSALSAEADLLRAGHPAAGSTRRAIEALARRVGW